MDDSPIVNYAKVDSVFNEDNPIIIVLFPNYEDRTKGVINSLKKTGNIDRQQNVKYVLFCLKNRANNNMLLEDLKEQNISAIKTTLADANIVEYWLEYPSNFSPNSLKSPLQALLEEAKNDNNAKNANIMFDISTTPKSVLFQLCESIKEFFQKDLVGRVYFSYCLPSIYSEVPYAQDIGFLKGLFSGEALSFSRDQAIHTIIFPSRSGHEGKLLCDTLDSVSTYTDYTVYFPVFKDSFTDSLNIMQANQTLIDRDSYLNCYYCTLDDAVKSLDELFRKEYKRVKQIIGMRSDQDEKKRTLPVRQQVYLVAPFGSKVFLPVAYFELLKLRSINPEMIRVEIANVKGFQYTSSYSLGGDGGVDGTERIALTCFEINREEIKSVIDLSSQNL